MSSTSIPRSMMILSMLVVPLVVWATLVTLLVPGVYGAGVNASILQQGIGQDWVTLLFSLPVTFVSIYLTMRGSIRGYLLLLGQLLYFAYTYLAATVLYPPNPMFPLHVVIFSASLFALLRGLFSLDAVGLKQQFRDGFPVRTTAGYLLLAGLFVGGLWIGTYIIPLYKPDVNAQEILGDQGPNLIIQALDLGVIVPLSILAGILLWRKQPWGYTLAGVMLAKAVTMLLAILAMVVMMIRAGQAVAVTQVVLFALLAVSGLVMLGLYLYNLQPNEEE